MRTSVIEVHDILSVFSVDEVEKRIGEVPGVESATVNFAAGNATVRYDETRLEVTDIKSAVRQRAYESTPAAAGAGDETLKNDAAFDAPEEAASRAAQSVPAVAAGKPPDMKATSTPPDPAEAEPPVESAAPEGDAEKDEAATDKA